MFLEGLTERPSRCPMKILTGRLMMVLLIAWKSKSLLIKILSLFLIAHPSPFQSLVVILLICCFYPRMVFRSYIHVPFILPLWVHVSPCRWGVGQMKCRALNCIYPVTPLEGAGLERSTDIGCGKLKLGLPSSQASSHCWKTHGVRMKGRGSTGP